MQVLKQRKPTRLKNYDYALKGYYFITICSKNRESIFGKYKNIVGAGLVSARDKIELSIIGKIIDKQWNDLPNQYDNIALDQYVIMPNHLHGIVIINHGNIGELASGIIYRGTLSQDRAEGRVVFEHLALLIEL